MGPTSGPLGDKIDKNRSVKSVLDHVILNVSNYARAKEFYSAALAPLGLAPSEADGYCGYGMFYITERSPVGGSVHVAFKAPDEQAVAAFHRAGLAAGGTDNGLPGPRPEIAEGYYAAFVLDLDGNNIEAVLQN
jgi:catechol 2,3-dioxygenase-like lactoylglutathione lyase family enzyme